ncbi:MAG: cupin domain-containing protein [bacterium]|nr:cupin domain-containing protein [bacterium]
MQNKPIAALKIAAPRTKTIYPEPFAAVVAGREKRKLGEFFGLKNFGVNLTRLAPGAASALLHKHSKQDEFIYVLEGTPTLLLDEEDHILQAGDCVGFPADAGVAHQLVNRSGADVVYIEVGDRTAGDQVEYPNDDLKATMGADGAWKLTRKDGSAY